MNDLGLPRSIPLRAARLQSAAAAMAALSGSAALLPRGAD